MLCVCVGDVMDVVFLFVSYAHCLTFFYIKSEFPSV